MEPLVIFSGTPKAEIRFPSVSPRRTPSKESSSAINSLLLTGISGASVSLASFISLSEFSVASAVSTRFVAALSPAAASSADTAGEALIPRGQNDVPSNMTVSHAPRLLVKRTVILSPFITSLLIAEIQKPIP